MTSILIEEQVGKIGHSASYNNVLERHRPQGRKHCPADSSLMGPADGSHCGSRGDNDYVFRSISLGEARQNFSPAVFFVVLVLVSPGVALSPVSHFAQVASHDLADDSNSVENSVRREGVDSSLRRYAFLALSQSKTGGIYNVNLAPVLSGIEAQVIELSSDTLKHQGLTFNEFVLPQGANLNANISSLMMIYRKISNFTVYSLPLQFAFGGPVVGIVSYSPSNVTTDDPATPQVDITFSNKSISVRMPLFGSLENTVPLCAFFYGNGTVTFDNLASRPNICTFATLGDVALVFPSSDSPPQHHSTPSPMSVDIPFSGGEAAKKWKLAVGAACVALAGLVCCIAVAPIAVRFVQSVRVTIIARFADNDEALQTSLIGLSRAPTAPNLRTKPALEIDMARFRE